MLVGRAGSDGDDSCYGGVSGVAICGDEVSSRHEWSGVMSSESSASEPCAWAVVEEEEAEEQRTEGRKYDDSGQAR